MQALTDAQVAFFKREGYLHLPGFFSPGEVAEFKTACKTNAPGDTACRTGFHNVMLTPKVVAVMKDLMGAPLIYPGLSLTRTDDVPKRVRSRFFHTDTVDEDGDYATEYPVINTGMYLQDHIAWSGGLKIMPRSHTRPCVTHKTVVELVKNITKRLLRLDISGAWQIVAPRHSINIPTMPGDFIVWYVRTHHSGYAVRPRFFPNLSLPPIIENWIPSFLRLPDNPERDVILSIYAAPSKYFESYLNAQVRKAHRKEHFLGNWCLESDELTRQVAALGVTIRNDGYHYARDPKSRFDVRPGQVLASGGQQ